MVDYIERARALRPLIVKAVESLDDSDALDGVELFERWHSDMELVVNQRIAHDKKLYRVVQAHMSQTGWEPDKTPALFTEVAKPGEIPEWKQPTGAQDAYAKGDKVRHNDKIWQSNTDNNVWEPGVYGWDKAE